MYQLIQTLPHTKIVYAIGTQQECLTELVDKHSNYGRMTLEEILDAGFNIAPVKH
jgi:hypothetical protein